MTSSVVNGFRALVSSPAASRVEAAVLGASRVSYGGVRTMMDWKGAGREKFDFQISAEQKVQDPIAKAYAVTFGKLAQHFQNVAEVPPPFCLDKKKVAAWADMVIASKKEVGFPDASKTAWEDVAGAWNPEGYATPQDACDDALNKYQSKYGFKPVTGMELALKKMEDKLGRPLSYDDKDATWNEYAKIEAEENKKATPLHHQQAMYHLSKSVASMEECRDRAFAAEPALFDGVSFDVTKADPREFLHSQQRKTMDVLGPMAATVTSNYKEFKLSAEDEAKWQVMKARMLAQVAEREAKGEDMKKIKASLMKA